MNSSLAPVVPALLLACSLLAVPTRAQDGPPPHVLTAVGAVERLIASTGDEALEAFLAEAMAPGAVTDRAALIERLRALRGECHGLDDGVAVEAEEDGVSLLLSSGEVERRVRIVLGPAGIFDLFLAAPVPRLDLTRENLAATFERLQAEGLAGVVRVQVGGEVLLERAFGPANEALGVENALDTAFCTGSRPIDYTIAAVQWLDQRGRLSLDDTIGAFFEDVPADKRAMTVRHLISGRSGLPDFFDDESDRDPDLGWVDRATAERRLLAAPLLFPPGTERRHSHAAFGLAAAIIERVTGTTYERFLRETFFDPAGMTRTGEYGETRGLSLGDFAEGGGPEFVGLPNIPPNWGPTSWLVKGSGGMYGTLGDLRRFYTYLRAGEVLDDAHAAPFRGATAALDGSMRGFELFSAFDPPGGEAYLFLNRIPDRAMLPPLFRALERLVAGGGEPAR